MVNILGFAGYTVCSAGTDTEHKRCAVLQAPILEFDPIDIHS